jgi:hypothetical protein
MVVFTPDDGPRSVDRDEVVAAYVGGTDGRHTYAVLVLRNGREIAGAVHNDALAALLADLPPDIAA